MSDAGVDSAVEKILADEEYARQVLQSPEEALTSQFDLEPGEWRAIHATLVKDVEDSFPDVQGMNHATANLSAVQFRRVAALPTFKGQFNRSAIGPTVVPG